MGYCERRIECPGVTSWQKVDRPGYVELVWLESDAPTWLESDAPTLAHMQSPLRLYRSSCRIMPCVGI